MILSETKGVLKNADFEIGTRGMISGGCYLGQGEKKTAQEIPCIKMPSALFKNKPCFNFCIVLFLRTIGLLLIVLVRLSIVICKFLNINSIETE